MLNITRLFSTKLAFRYVAFTSDGVFQSARFTLAYQALSGCSESACVLQNSLKALREIILICVLYHNWAFRHKKIRFGSSSRRQWHQFKDYLLNTLASHNDYMTTIDYSRYCNFTQPYARCFATTDSSSSIPRPGPVGGVI